MRINWCFKGIEEIGSFDDAMAERVLTETGLLSEWSSLALTARSLAKPIPRWCHYVPLDLGQNFATNPLRAGSATVADSLSRSTVSWSASHSGMVP